MQAAKQEAQKASRQLSDQLDDIRAELQAAQAASSEQLRVLEVLAFHPELTLPPVSVGLSNFTCTPKLQSHLAPHNQCLDCYSNMGKVKVVVDSVNKFQNQKPKQGCHVLIISQACILVHDR